MLPSGLNTQLATKATFVGIDFGTSTTVVSIATKESGEEKIKTLPIKLTQILEDGTIYQSEKLPSVIAWYNGRLLVGEGASNLKYTLTKGKNIWFSFKMEIGEDLGAKYYNSEVGDMEGVKIRNPKDCVRVFFMYLNMLIKKYCQDNGLSDNIMYAVSIPASFEANQRKELMEALESNGMNISKQSLIDEPNAAFISYVHDSEESEKPLLISPRSTFVMTCKSVIYNVVRLFNSQSEQQNSNKYAKRGAFRPLFKPSEDKDSYFSRIRRMWALLFNLV